jgi:UDP-N-acetylmuramate--alanine ligase
MLTRERPTVAISGTHGKSTATALTSHVLNHAGTLCGSLCGAENLGRGRHGWATSGTGSGWLVVEACEYRRHFLELSPRIGVVLGIEPDHVDCYPRLSDSEAAYAEFFRRIATDGSVIVNGDCEATLRALRDSGATSPIRLSTTGSSDWWAEGVIQSSGSLTFAVFYRGTKEAEVSLPIIGRQHVMNALAAIAVGRLTGIDRRCIVEALASFPGLHRRLERLPDWRGVTRFDDYAHHPTAVRAALAAIREIGEGRRLWCVFQPHQVSRTVALHKEYTEAFGAADHALILPVYGAREISSAAQVEASRRLAESIRSPERSEFMPTLDHVRTRLETACRHGDLLVTLGAGDIDRLHDELA